MSNSPVVTIRSTEPAEGRHKTVVKIAGELSLPPGTEQVERDLNRACAGQPELVVLDLSELTYISSLGMGILMTFRKDVVRNGGNVSLAGVRPIIREILTHARLDKLFQFQDSVEIALA